MSHVLCYGQGLEGIVLLKDPVGINLHKNRIQCIFRLTICSLHIFAIGMNIRNYLQAQCIRLGADYNDEIRNDVDIIFAVRSLRLNGCQVCK